MSDDVVEQQIAELVAQRAAAALAGWADYEIRAIGGELRFNVEAVSALGFTYQNFGMSESHAVSCDVCGVLFVESLDVMRRHRLRCGWSP